MEEKENNSNINNISNFSQNIQNKSMSKDNNVLSPKKSGNFVVHKTNNIEGLEIHDYSDANTDLKIPASDNGDKDDDNNSNKEDVISVKSNAVFDIVNNAKKFFGIDKQSSKKRDAFNRRTLSNRYLKNTK